MSAKKHPRRNSTSARTQIIRPHKGEKLTSTRNSFSVLAFKMALIIPFPPWKETPADLRFEFCGKMFCKSPDNWNRPPPASAESRHFTDRAKSIEERLHHKAILCRSKNDKAWQHWKSGPGSLSTEKCSTAKQRKAGALSRRHVVWLFRLLEASWVKQSSDKQTAQQYSFQEKSSWTAISSPLSSRTSM